ncbi:hypothetical protein [Serinicoccus kebangsaanensis]|uniref:hypothetical protein n=1 Tax=Serinicoccus kebangsaanensis TaxID=2602069 RepID=UPI00124E690E|nr:hypothetical protein [Serinicoccus kebangsaanensis]
MAAHRARGTPGIPEPAPGQRDEHAALEALRKGTAPMWRSLVPMWLILVPLMTLMSVWILQDRWSTALLYGLLYGSFFVLMWGWAEGRRRGTRLSARDATEVERGVVTAVQEGWVTVRGAQHELTWRVDTTGGLGTGELVYAAPRLAPGEHIVLIRASRSRAAFADVIGARSDAELVDPD